MISKIIEMILSFFKNKKKIVDKEVIDKTVGEDLGIDKKPFFDYVRENIFSGSLTEEQVKGLNTILKYSWVLSKAETAYVLATAYHETAKRMQPISEYGSDSRFTNLYDIKGKNPRRAKRYGNVQEGDGIRYRGRGFVQLTWKNNYEKMSKILGVDLVNNPDLACETDIAAKILIEGMRDGVFTGKGLSNYINSDKKDYKNARRIVNGMDKASQIASYAIKFEKALDKYLPSKVK